MNCEAAEDYKRQVNARKETEIKTLANLTGWETADIRRDIKASGKGDFFPDTPSKPKTDWWNKLWPKEE